MKITTKSIRKLKGIRPVVAVTAYDSIMAHLASQAEADLILVGDSMGNAILGFDTTIPVTLDMMIHHTAAVVRGKPESLVVGDVPFAIAHGSFESLLAACMRFLQEAGAEAVKIEGGANLAGKIARLVDAGIPVLGHIGLHPQKVHALGGYRRYGKTKLGRESLLEDAQALQEAGVFAIIGEMIEADTSAEITDSLDVPFIGIGCGPHCDGQILVCTDLLGMTTGYVPAFVKTYANLAETIQSALTQYGLDVRNREFPGNPKN